MLNLGRFALLLASAALLAGCSSRPKDTLPDVKLETLSARKADSLASCPTPKCLTVYVAPWCGYCRAASPLILALRDYLKEHGVSTRIIVGMSDEGQVRRYAKFFGPETMLDPSGRYNSGGVPHFIVSNKDGRILRDVPGLPMGIESVPQFASYYDLP